MWRWVVIWQATSILLVRGTLDIGFFTQKRQYVPTSEVSCFEYAKFNTDRWSKIYNEDWRTQKTPIKHLMAISGYPMKLLNTNDIISRRFDILLPKEDDIVREHAKLVQDINSLKQVVFVAPIVDTSRDYDDSIFNEIIETTSTTTPKPTSPTVLRSTKPSSFPVILLGGASRHQIVKSQPIHFFKPSISLVGTTVSPLVKHPYPFIGQGTSRKPLKVCMPTIHMYTTMTRRPSLWERLLNTIIPR